MKTFDWIILIIASVWIFLLTVGFVLRSIAASKLPDHLQSKYMSQSGVGNIALIPWAMLLFVVYRVWG